MSGFKDMVERDISKVFQNTDEFAELHQVVYEGTTYSIPVVLDNTAAKDRPIVTGDNAEGLYIVATTFYASYADMQCVPKKDQRIRIDDDDYRIVTSSCDMGHIALGLRRFDE